MRVVLEGDELTRLVAEAAPGDVRIKFADEENGPHGWFENSACWHEVEHLERAIGIAKPNLVLDRIYRGYRLVNHGYYPPDRCVWWQAENIQTGEADFHAHTMRDLKAQIDKANESMSGGR
jgi:hypothetical protein